MKTSLPRLAFLALCLSGLAGCLSHLTFGGIAVTIDDLKPATAKTPATLTLHFANENVVAVGIDSSTHRLYLNGSLVGTAVNTKPLGVQAMSSGTQEAPVKFENPALVQQLAAAAGARTTSYRLESDLLLLAGEEKIHAKSVEQGTLDLNPLAGAR